MVYLPKPKRAKRSTRLPAQFQWNTYATQLGRGYTTAYKFHQKAIDDINENPAESIGLSFCSGRSIRLRSSETLSSQR
jgi:hypothetical protein